MKIRYLLEYSNADPRCPSQRYLAAGRQWAEYSNRFFTNRAEKSINWKTKEEAENYIIKIQKDIDDKLNKTQVNSCINNLTLTQLKPKLLN